jgi:biofilm PGA synthesis N-glycosyltransferase PgaC
MLSVLLSIPWLHDLSHQIGFVPALSIITFLAYVPGYLVSFTVVSLLLDRQPPFKPMQAEKPVTVLIAAYNEENRIPETLRYIKIQDYEGEIRVLIANNNSGDGTSHVARQTAKDLGIRLQIIDEENQGKCHALNTGLRHIETEYFITLDADTLLHKSAIRNIICRMLSAPEDVCAVAGHVLVRNSRDNFLTRLQEWDYFLGIASIKRMQGLYQGTLVAQGAFSLYKTEAVRLSGGWPDAIGEDIVLTWNFFIHGYRVYFEPLAIAFTETPKELKHFISQRSRWARGMVEGLTNAGPWRQERSLSIYLSMLDLLIPPSDLTYTLVWIPGLALAFTGRYYIVGPYTLLVLPLNFVMSWIMYIYQKHVFIKLGLCVRKNRAGFFAYILLYQFLASPISVLGYTQEVLRLKRIWK